MKNELSRRSSLKGAALSALAVGTMGMPNVATEAKAEEAPSTGKWYDEKYFAKPAPITDIAETIETDVVVVGAGNGGCISVVSAAELGAKVVWVEKNGGPITWAGEIGAYNSKLMKERYGIEYTQEQLNEIINDVCRYGSYEVDQRLVALWVNESGRTMDWFVDKMKAKGIETFIETDMKQTLYKNEVQTHTVYKGEFKELGPNFMGSQVANPLRVEYAEEMGVTKLFLHTAKQLVQDENGKVTGIIVQRNEDGKYIQINASKGVILSTGGYGGNPEMMDALHYRDKNNIVNNLGCAFAMGDGIKMALWAGADIDRNHAGGCAFDRAALAEDHHVGAPYSSGLNDIWWPGTQPWLNLNKRGERFANEDVPYDFHINSWLKQPGRFTFQLFDSNYWADVNAFHSTICSRVVAVPGARNSEVLPGVMPCKSEEEFYNVYMKPALESGRLKQADTIEDLCKQLGMDEAAIERAVASVARYNELCEKGVDDDFGKQTKDMRPILKAPFYGIAVGTWLLATMNGIRVNTNLQAINEEHEPIEGLYVIGNDMGGFFNNSYPQMYGGTMQGKTTCFARLAALHAVTGSIYEG
jgi:succinate dehydrogenase/fumarate reductase flavoprotein subunit